MRIVMETTLDLFRGRGPCEMCRARCEARDPHHVFAKGMGGGNRLDITCNLIGCCRTCHSTKADTAEDKQRCLEIIAARERVSVDVIKRVLFFILQLDKDVSAWKLEEQAMALSAQVQRIVRRELILAEKLT